MVSSKSLVPEPLPSVRLPADKRREQLIHVAVDLFSRKGFKGTTTKEIATAAGVTEAIIFRHFQTKEDLYTAIIDHKIYSPEAAGWIAGLQSAMDRDNDEAVIRELITAVIATHRIDPRFERVMIYAALEGNEIALMYMRQVTACIVDQFRCYFSRRQKQGSLSAVSPDAALMAIVGMAKHYALNKYVHGLEEQCLSDEQAIESFTRIAMNGYCITGRPGRLERTKKR